MKRRILIAMTALLSSAAMIGQAHAQQQPFQGTIGRTLAESREWWPEPARAPAGAPNVVWILLDDVGFGASSAFGGGIATPALEQLAQQGLRYTNFHTTAICAPTRSALLTGRNSSSVHEAGFSHIPLSAGFPGWDGRIPATAGTIAEILRDDGYNTFAVGKYGLTPDEDATDAGPFACWPTGKGFEHFFGFLGSQTDQYKPDLVEDQAHVKPDGRHLSEQITDRAIAYIDRQHQAAPNKPFFLYYAPGATHAPHQVAAEWSDRYKGKFDEGWDAYRQRVFAQQKRAGIIPANAVLPDRDPGIAAWNSLPPEEKRLYARFMEVYAGYLTYTDHEIGRVVDHLKATGQYDNTLFVVIVGDNGASKEGTVNGDIDRTISSKPLSYQENVAYNLSKANELGTPDAVQGNYPLGWAQAANTPFRLWKSDANSEGGTRNPLIISYPKAIHGNGAIRTQYGHVIDILPTTLDVLGLKAPDRIGGTQQQPIEGISLAYSITDAKAPSQHRVQYYYIFGSRAIYQDGWKAALPYPNRVIAGSPNAGKPFDENAWELYNLNEDPTERVNLAQRNPRKVAELRALFEKEAQSHNLYPLLTWDDLRSGSLHRPGNSDSPQVALEKLTQHPRQAQ